MNMKVIKPLIVGDMTERMLNERKLDRLANIELAPMDDMIEQIGRCTTMSDINQLLCSYHYLFTNHPKIGNVVSVDGTQEYVIKLLTERIETDADIIYDALKYG
tara:strand:- start:6 stop:317 length:312 start_codon:yes stop_codon:yes gene_type:complete